jgi:hypothetical protein
VAERPRVIHPFLFAAFPVLYLYAANVQEGVTFWVVAPVLAIVLAASGLALLLARWAFRDAARAGLAVSGLVLLFFTYGHVRSVIQNAGAPGLLGQHRLQLAGWALLGVAVVVLAIRIRGRLPGITRGLNLVAAALVLFNVISVGIFEVETLLQGRTATDLEAVPLDPPSSGRPPDIYYILLDRYGGQEALREFVGFDNRELIGFLEDRGFIVASESRANYPRTYFSIASALNFEHVGFLTESEGAESSDTRPLISMIRNHRVARSLKPLGYRYVHIGSWWDPTARNPLADVNVPYTGVAEFPSVLLQTTAAWPVINLNGGGLGRRRDWIGVQQQFEALVRSYDVAGPKFVFAHILSPHEPFVFDRYGNFVSEVEEARRPRARNYVEQLLFVNGKIRELVETLLSGPDDPVIVIQSDEGPYEGPAGWRMADDSVLRRKFSILSAFYLPGEGDLEPHLSITPVNTFRLVFGRYLGADLPLLPDRSYVYADMEHLFELTDVTDRVSSEAPAG